jgi:tRNA G26 N,N-dimethylase Trm1
MPLKIIGRTPPAAREHREKPQEARGVKLHCDACDKDVMIAFPYYCTALQRQQIIKKAADEHRQVMCTALDTVAARKFQILYPRA